MITIKYSEIPAFLRNGLFFQSLSEEEKDGEIQVPDRCFTKDETVNNIDDFTKLLKVATFWGLTNIPLGLIVFCNESDPMDITTLIGTEFAAIDFAQDLCKIFVPASASEPHNPLVNAIKIGRTEVVAYLIKHSFGGMEAAVAAAEHGRLECLKLLHENGHPWDEFASDKAAAGGHLGCLQYLHENGCPWDGSVIFHAAENGHLECLKYVYDQGAEWHPGTAERLSEKSEMEMLRYAMERGCHYDAVLTCGAAFNGHVECLRYLMEVGCRIHYVTLEHVLKGGYLECLKLLIEHHNAFWDEGLPAEAAKYGHLEIIQYLHQNGCPWDESVTFNAAQNGHYNILSYAIEHGCDYNHDHITSYATRTVNESGLQCLKYLIEQRELPVTHNGKLFMEAFTHGNYLAVEYLFTKGPSVTIIPDELRRKRWRQNLQSCLNYLRLPNYDSNLAKCIECAAANNWDVQKEATEVIQFVSANRKELPVCAVLLNLNDTD